MDRKPAYEYPPLILCPPWWFDYEVARSHGLHSAALTYSLGYGTFPFTYFDDRLKLLFDDESGSLEKLLQSEKIAKLNDTLMRISEVLEQGKEQFFEFYRRNSFSCVTDYYKYIATNLTQKDEDAENSSLHLSGCSGCDQSEGEFEKVIYNNAVCYVIPLKKATATSVDQPTIVEIRNIDRTNGVIDANSGAWLMDFASTVGPSGPSIRLEAFSSYNVKLTAQRMIMLKGNPACNNTDVAGKAANEQSLCVDKCIADLMHTLGLKHESLMTNSCSPDQLLNNFDAFATISHQLPKIIEIATEVNDLNATSEADIEFMRLLGANITESSYRLMDKAIPQCYEECLPACDRTVYDITLDSTSMKGGKPKNESSIVLQIKHSAIFQGGIMTWQEVTTFSFSEFVSNVGGTLGLFLGCTMMTVAQVVLSLINYGLNKRLPEGRKCDPPS